MSYGSSPVTTILTQSHAIYNPIAFCSDSDTFVDSTNAENFTTFFNTSLTCNASITGGTVLGGPNTSYDAATGKITNTWTIEGPELASTGTEKVYYDTFTWTDGGPAAIRDTAVSSTNVVIHRYPKPTEQESGGGG
jgi:hypothetical protein